LIKFSDSYFGFDYYRQELYQYDCFILSSQVAHSVSYNNIKITNRLIELFLNREYPNCLICEKTDYKLAITYPFGKPTPNLEYHIRDYSNNPPCHICDDCLSFDKDNLKGVFNNLRMNFGCFLVYIKFVESELERFDYTLENCSVCNHTLFQFITFIDNNIKVRCCSCDTESKAICE